MKFGLIKLILAFTAAIASARLGSERRLCGENRDGCTPYLDPCCNQFSCHIDGRCYKYPREEKGPCIPYAEQCGEGLTCDFLSLKCRTVGTEVDDKCNFSRQCEGNILGKPLTCDLYTNRCRLPGEEGDTCHATRLCDRNLQCSATSGTCQRPSNAGQECNVSQRCNDGLTCDLTGGICRGKSDVGGKCHLSRRCMSNLYCDYASETCRNAGQAGERCNIYVPCASSNLFCDDNDRCEEKPDKCEVEGGNGCPDGIDPVDTDPDEGKYEEPDGIACNLATGDCDPVSAPPTGSPTESPTPSPVTPTSSTPSVAPTTEPPSTAAPSPTPPPTFRTPMPTKLEEKCPLTGCTATLNSQPAKISLTSEEQEAATEEQVTSEEEETVMEEQVTSEEQETVIEEKASVLDETRGGAGGMQHQGGQRRQRWLEKGE